MSIAIITRKIFSFTAVFFSTACVVVPNDQGGYMPAPPSPPMTTIYEHYDYNEGPYYAPYGRYDRGRYRRHDHGDHGGRWDDRRGDRREEKKEREHKNEAPPPSPSPGALEPLPGKSASGSLREFLKKQAEKGKQ